MSLSPQTAELLQRFIRLYRTEAQPHEPLFLSERGTPLGYMSLYSKLARIGARAGCGRLNPDILRRTFLKRLCEREQDLRVIQQQAGHASHKTTARLLKRLADPPSQRGAAAAGKTAARRRRTDSMDEGRAAVFPGQADRCRKTNTACGACGRSFARSIGVRIDSGQILCPDCIRELRNRPAAGNPR